MPADGGDFGVLRGGVIAAPEAEINAGLRLTVYMVLAGRRWRQVLDERLRPAGQSAARMETLWVIAYTPTLSPQVEIARRMGIEGATLTRMLDSLQKDGLVERLADPADRRSKHIRLTKAGEAALAESLAIARDLRASLLEGLESRSIDGAIGFLGLLLDRLDGGLPLAEGDAAMVSSAVSAEEMPAKRATGTKRR